MIYPLASLFIFVQIYLFLRDLLQEGMNLDIRFCGLFIAVRGRPFITLYKGAGAFHSAGQSKGG